MVGTTVDVKWLGGLALSEKRDELLSFVNNKLCQNLQKFVFMSKTQKVLGEII